MIFFFYVTIKHEYTVLIRVKIKKTWGSTLTHIYMYAWFDETCNVHMVHTRAQCGQIITLNLYIHVSIVCLCLLRSCIFSYFSKWTTSFKIFFFAKLTRWKQWSYTTNACVFNLQKYEN